MGKKNGLRVEVGVALLLCVACIRLHPEQPTLPGSPPPRATEPCIRAYVGDWDSGLEREVVHVIDGGLGDCPDPDGRLRVRDAGFDGLGDFPVQPGE